MSEENSFNFVFIKDMIFVISVDKLIKENISSVLRRTVILNYHYYTTQFNYLTSYYSAIGEGHSQSSTS